MQKNKNLSEPDGSGLTNLPAIKKSGSGTLRSPKVLKTTGGFHSAHDQTNESPEANVTKGPNELLIHKLDSLVSTKEAKHQNTRSRHDKLVKKIHELESTNRTLEEELKRSKSNNELKIHGEYMYETVSSTNKKNQLLKEEEKSENLEFTRENLRRHKYKDIELFNSKKKNEEMKSFIDNLKDEMSSLKAKNKVIEECNQKMQLNLADTESIIKAYQNSLKNCEIKLYEREGDLKYKKAELDEINELLKKSEDKRKMATEYSNTVETSMAEFQRQIVSMKNINIEQQKEIKEQIKIIQMKNGLINDYEDKIKSLESKLDAEKAKNTFDTIEFEKSKENLKSIIEQNCVKIDKLESENNKLYENISQLQKEIRKPAQILPFSKRAETVIESKYFADLTREEAARWHSRYFATEQELLSTKHELEKVTKDYEYFKFQIGQKNLMLERLELFIESQEKPITVDSSPYSEHIAHIAEITTLVDNMSLKNKSLDEYFKCSSCFKHCQKNYLCFPCLHICCSNCKDELYNLCPKCSQKVVDISPAVYFDSFSSYYMQERDCLESVKKLLNYQQFV